MGGVPEASRVIGISPPTLYRALAGEVTPSFEFLEKVDAQGIDMGALLGAEKPTELERLKEEITQILSKLDPKDRRELLEIVKLIAKAKETNE